MALLNKLMHLIVKVDGIKNQTREGVKKIDAAKNMILKMLTIAVMMSKQDERGQATTGLLKPI